MSCSAFIAEWTPEAQGVFSWSRRLFASFHGQLDALYNSPQHAIVQHVAEEWILNEWDRMPPVADVLKGLNEAHPRYPSTRLPSKKSRMVRPDILSAKGASMTLEWIAHPEKYKSDIDSYVWQYYLDAPPRRSVTIFVLPTDDLRQRRLAILFSHHKLLHDRFTKLPEKKREEMRRGRKQDKSEKKEKKEMGENRVLGWHPGEFPGFHWQHQWAANHEILNVVLLFYDWMNEDTALFIDEVGSELRKMVRGSPNLSSVT